MSKYAALYVRVSTSNQQKGAEAQERSLIEFASSRGIMNYKIYRDIGVSGTKESRVHLDKMLDDVKSGLISTVVVYSFSRYARSTRFLIESLEMFRNLDVEFISITERIETNSPIGKAVFVIISAIATLERDLISERVKNGLKNAVSKGKRLGRPKTRNTELIISLREKGYTYKQISELLSCGHGSITRAIEEHRNSNL